MQHLCSPHNHGIKYYSMPRVRGPFISPEYFFYDDAWSAIIFNYTNPAHLAKVAIRPCIVAKVDGYPKWEWKINANWLL